MIAAFRQRSLLVTTPLDIYAAPGSARRGFWRPFVGIALIIAGWLIWTAVVMAAFVLYNLASGLGIAEALEALSGFIQASSPAREIGAQNRS
jgi:hypothetical protein